MSSISTPLLLTTLITSSILCFFLLYVAIISSCGPKENLIPLIFFSINLFLFLTLKKIFLVSILSRRFFVESNAIKFPLLRIAILLHIFCASNR